MDEMSSHHSIIECDRIIKPPAFRCPARILIHDPSNISDQVWDFEVSIADFNQARQAH
jgi:hypothetical protein